MNLGSMMDCNRLAFHRAIMELKDRELIRYLEVGCAYGVTCIGVSTYLEAVRMGRWQSVMLDKKEGGWAFNPDACKHGAGRLWGAMIGCGETLDNLEKGKIYLNDDGSDKFLNACPDKFDVILIDACHSKECCTKDFRAIEPMVNRGGFVFFHDADPKSQGLDVQPHCNKPIEVRQALKDLGLMDNTRNGWVKVEDIQPENHEEQRGCVVIRKYVSA